MIKVEKNHVGADLKYLEPTTFSQLRSYSLEEHRPWCRFLETARGGEAALDWGAEGSVSGRWGWEWLKCFPLPPLPHWFDPFRGGCRWWKHSVFSVWLLVSVLPVLAWSLHRRSRRMRCWFWLGRMNSHWKWSGRFEGGDCCNRRLLSGLSPTDNWTLLRPSGMFLVHLRSRWWCMRKWSHLWT